MDGNIETTFVEANGLTFEVETCGSGDRLALCLHGFPELAHSWRHQLPLLARLGYTAWAPNLRGYGRSSRPARRADYALEHLLADVAGLIDAAGKSSTLLLGHDWGGMLAWMFALRRMRPLERLIVMNIPHPLLFVRGLDRWSQRLKSWYILWFQVPRLPELLLGMGRARPIAEILRRSAVDPARFPDEVLEVYREAARQPGAITAMLNWYRANFDLTGGRLTEQDREALETRLQTPTLMIWGEQDIALAKYLTYGTGELVEDFTLRYLPRVGHFVQQEAPETVNAIIEGWLSGSRMPGTEHTDTRGEPDR
ncbi:MAG TPA: alpha/beta hydrolase [Gammaproteobacteria bacterium]|nr:alpha/beta hydrolase [Gammaproteobacteria bacterium]